MRKDWAECTFEDLLDYVQPTNYIVKSTNYSDDFKTPVLTAGKSFIKGYTDEADGIFDNLPTIIFDDFTTATQFVNFKFKVKSSAMKILVPKSKLVNMHLIFYAMQVNQIRNDTHKRYWISVFAKKKFQLPPLAEQTAIFKKIEELFSSLDSGIADLKKAQEQLVIYRQAVLKKAFEGGFTHQKTRKTKISVNGIKSIIPENWKVVSIGDIAKLQGGFAFKSSEFTDSGIPIVKIKNVHFQNIDWDDITYIALHREQEFKNYSLKEGDVLIAMTRPVIKSLNNIKTVVVAKKDLPALLNQRVGRFVINGELNKNYLKYFIFTDFFKRRVLKESSSSQQPNISSTKIEKFDFILPLNLKEQHHIVQEIESRLSVCDKVEESIAESLEKAKALRQSILKKAFEGKLLSAAEIARCKQDKDYEPAGVLLESIKKEKKNI